MTYPFPPPLEYIPSGTTAFTGPLTFPNHRYLFLATFILLLFVTKCAISLQMNHTIITPDEIVYGNTAKQFSIKHLADFSLYLPIPFFLDYHQTLLVNCLLTSLCAIPVFYIFLRHHSERKAALLTALVMLAPCLWLFSLVNMTEAMLFLVVLVAAWNPTKEIDLQWLKFHPLDWLSPLVKPIGLPVVLARYKNGPYLALGLGLVFAILFYGQPPSNPILNLILALWRSASYLFIATAGMVGFLIYRYFTTGLDEDDWFALMLTVTTFALVFPTAIRIPFESFYGRYFDAAGLVILTTALKPIEKGRKFILFTGLVAFLAIAYVVMFPFHSLLDSGAMLFTDVVKNALYSAHVLAGS